LFEKATTLWELVTGKKRAKLAAHSDNVFSTCFSPDGKLLASASMDHTIRLWQLPACESIHTFEGHRSWVLSVVFSPDGQKLLSGGLDTTGVLWKVPAVANPKGALKPAELTRLWDDLAGDAWDAYRAIGSVVAAADQTVPFLTQQLKPVAPPDPAQVTKLIADLDSTKLPVRQQAITELEKMGELVAPHLQKALAKPASVEMALRVQQILDTVASQLPGSQILRGLRAVEALEYIATPPARTLLKTLSQGAPGATLTREALAAMKRLEK
jgi:hypothetical protein